MEFKFNFKLSHRVKLFIFISLEMIAIITIFLLILFAGKKRYTVTFDLNGGELLSGDLIQEVTRGQNATPPSVTKDGCYLLKWSDSYTKVTRNVYAKAIWEYETTSGIEYDVIENSNYCLISGCYKELSGTVYIGAYYNGLKVLGIKENAFANCSRISNIYLLDGMLSIGDNAFANCTNLKKINIPETVENIGDGAFANCTSLEKITIPDSVENVGEGAFENCENLESVIISESKNNLTIESNAFKNCTKLTTITFDEVVEEPTDEDLEPTNIEVEEITPEKKNKVILGASSFENCTSLAELEITERVLEIGASAFKNCLNLEEVVISSGVQKIGDNAFAGCTKIEEITIPESVIVMGNEVFTHDTLTINLYFKQTEIPETFAENWFSGNPTIVYEFKDLEVQTKQEENLE